MTPRALFLDVGGTLVRERRSRFEVYAATARAAGVDVTATEMGVLMRRAHAELPRVFDGHFRYSDPWFEAFIRRVFGAWPELPVTTVDGLVTELFSRFESPGTFELDPGARGLLAAARERGLVVGVVSNWSARLERVLAAVGLEGAFDFVLCSALEGTEKPEPEIFRRALARAAVEPGEALHAGDDLRNDVEGPAALGIPAVLVDPRGKYADRELPCPRVTGLGELRATIL